LSEPVYIAAIDAGSNAIRVAICAATSATDITPLVRERVPVRLGHNTFIRGELDPETVDQAVAAFARFRTLFDQYQVAHYRAVSTSAVRNAKNRETLLHRLYHDTQIELEVIDGEEEASIVRRAVLSTFPPDQGPSVIVDLGGGSLEVTNRDSDEWHTASMRIGTVRLMETFGLTGSISPDEAKMMRRYVASLLHSAVPLAELEPGTMAAACGGNAEELASLFGYRDEALGMLVLTAEQLEAALPKLLKYEVEKRMNKFGVRQDRAEVMGVAALVFATVMEVLKLERMVVPQVGIREGLLLELADAYVGEASRRGASRERALVASARAFAARLGHDTPHDEQVRWLARTLFDGLASLHELPADTGVLLEVAALLHDVGEVIHRKGHHKHGEYMVLHGRIPGLISPEREMVAALVRAHRKSLPYPKKHVTYATLDDFQQNAVRKLGALLRLADAIDTDHRQRVVDLHPEIRDDRVVLHVGVEGEAGEAPLLAQRKTEAFTQELGLPVTLEVASITALAHRQAARTE